ncbi:MAG TPA: hypothetical protein VIP98_24375, partial [Microlunatus sp.]
MRDWGADRVSGPSLPVEWSRMATVIDSTAATTSSAEIAVGVEAGLPVNRATATQVSPQQSAAAGASLPRPRTASSTPTAPATRTTTTAQ